MPAEFSKYDLKLICGLAEPLAHAIKASQKLSLTGNIFQLKVFLISL